MLSAIKKFVKNVISGIRNLIVSDPIDGSIILLSIPIVIFYAPKLATVVGISNPILYTIGCLVFIMLTAGRVVWNYRM